MTTTHFFELRDQNNSRIACRIDRPETATHAGLAAILCHGMFSSMEGDKHRLYSRMLTDMGIPVLRFDFPGSRRKRRNRRRYNHRPATGRPGGGHCPRQGSHRL